MGKRNTHPDSKYQPKQASEHVFPHVSFIPDWFIDLGPGSAMEFLEAKKQWPKVKLLGLEPSPIGIEYAKNRWPDDGLLLQAAAWNEDCQGMTLHKAHDLLHGTMYLNFDKILAEDTTGESLDQVLVPCRSLDSLDKEYGPFGQVFLWMDIEGSERRALRGATGLFDRCAIRGVNLEVRPAYQSEIANFLGFYGLKLAHRYFETGTGCDEVWILN